MAVSRAESGILSRAYASFRSRPAKPPQYTCIFCQHLARSFASSSRTPGGKPYSNQGPFSVRLRTALRKTKVDWHPIPITLGIGFLGAVQFYRARRREKVRQEQEAEEAGEWQDGHKPAKRKRIRPSGPWYVEICGPNFLFTSHPNHCGSGRSKSCRVFP